MRKNLPGAVAAHAPLAAVLLALLLAGLSPALAPRGLLPLTAELPFWVVVAVLAALHRPLDRPRRPEQGAAPGPYRSTLGLGTLALAPAVDQLGAVPAAIAAAAAFLLAEMGAALVERRTLAGIGPRLDASLAGAAPVAAASLAAGAAIVFTAAAPQASSRGLAALSALAVEAAPSAVAYVLSFAFVSWWTLVPRRSAAGRAADSPPGGVLPLRPLVLDAAGWLLGVLLAQAAPVLGWTRVGLLAAALALLAAEAARQAMVGRLSEHRAGRLQRMQRAHARILGETSGVEEVAEQILAECRRVLPVQWFQLEIESAEESPAAPSAAGGTTGAGRTSWAAGPDGELRRGRPQPPAWPRTLPGIHRRAAWQILECPLEAEGETLAVVRLWCDPRRIKPGAEELLSALVPQMASSVHRTRLERQARLDPLTGIPLRRPFERALEQAYRRSYEEGLPMAVVMSDIDFFKRINDTYGHAAGDQALILVARTLDSQRREGDLCCRYGGEEFILLLEGTSGEPALQLAERLRRAVESLDLVFEDRRIPLTLSAGVAAFPELHVKSASELLLLADEALYEAKEQGRNRSLLNLGQGTFRAPSGELVRSGPVPERRLPRIFG